MLLKGLLFTMTTVFFSNSDDQLFWLLTIICVFTYLSAGLRPWRANLGNHLDVATGLCNGALVFAVRVFGVMWGTTTTDAVATGLVVFPYGLTGVFLVMLAVKILRPASESRVMDRVRDVEDVLRVSLEDSGRLRAIITGLTEQDSQCIFRVVNIFAVELGLRRGRGRLQSTMLADKKAVPGSQIELTADDTTLQMISVRPTQAKRSLPF